MPSTYRILHVIDHLGSGGAQESVVNLVKYCRRELFQPEVATLHGFGHYWEVLRPYGIPLYSLAPRWYRRAAVPLILGRLFRLMAQNRYDIVHCHTYGPNVLATIMAALCRVPLRINHDRNRDDLRYRYQSLRWLDFLGNSLATCVLAGSKSVRDFLCLEETVPESKVRLMYNGVDLERFTPKDPASSRKKWRQALGLPADSLLVGGIGRLHYQKDFPLFLRVAAEVSAMIPQAVFLIAGDGEDRSALEKLSRELGLAPKVHFLGFVKDMPGLYEALDLLLFPTLFEGTSLTTLEALAMGVPLVCSRVDGPAEILDDGREAMLVPLGDKEGFVQAVCRLLLDRDFALQLARAGQTKVRQRHSVQAVVGRIEDFYLEHLESRSWSPCHEQGEAAPKSILG
jgi:glycosyltransferase involved in cell wall biosynthesis